MAQFSCPTTGKRRPRARLPPSHSAPPHQVDITELIQPEAVLGGGDSWEVVDLETLVAEPHGLSQPTADPAVYQALMASRLGGRGQISQGEGARTPQRKEPDESEAIMCPVSWGRIPMSWAFPVTLCPTSYMEASQGKGLGLSQWLQT